MSVPKKGLERLGVVLEEVPRVEIGEGGEGHGGC